MIYVGSKGVLSFQKTGLVLTPEGKRSIHFLKKVCLTEVMKRQEMEHYCVAPWLFGQEGEDREHKLKTPCGITTYTDLVTWYKFTFAVWSKRES